MGEERVWNVGTGIWFVDTAYLSGGRGLYIFYFPRAEWESLCGVIGLSSGTEGLHRGFRGGSGWAEAPASAGRGR